MDPVNVDMLSSESSNSSDVGDGSATELIEIPVYKCKYCPKRYSKTQALGGHQNAHKREREITERQKRAMLASMNQPDPYAYPYGNPYNFVMAQLQPLISTSSPVCLDLCLGVGSSSQYQAQPEKLNGATEEMAAEKEDNDDIFLSLSLKL